MFDPADAPDPDDVYANYLKTCAMLGVEPVPRERAVFTANVFCGVTRSS